MKEFHVDRFFWSAFLGALIVSVVSFILNSILGRKKRVQHSTNPPPPRRDDNVIDV